HVVDGPLERGDGLGAGTLLDDAQGVVHDAFGHRALAPEEHLVDDLGDEDRPVDGVGAEVAAGSRALTRHGGSLVPLGAVAAAGLLAVLDTTRVERASDDLVPHTGQVLHPAAAHEHDRVLLEVVALAGNVGGDLHPAGEAHPSHLAEGGVRLLGGVRVHPRAHAATLGRALPGGGLRLVGFGAAGLAAPPLAG